MKLHYKSHELKERLEPAQLGLEYTAVEKLAFPAQVIVKSGDDEVCLVCIQGEISFEGEGQSGVMRMKDLLYVPIHSEVILVSDQEAVVMRYSAPSDLEGQLTLITFDEVNNSNRHHTYGKAETNSVREVWNYIDEAFVSSRFLVGMCESRTGSWTAWPPHEHGDIREEVYVYFNMGHSYGIQCLYEDMANPLAVALVQEGDLVSVPKGYHPNTSCPGGKLSYIYCMVSKTPGDRNFMDLTIQPEFGNKFE